MPPHVTAVVQKAADLDDARHRSSVEDENDEDAERGAFRPASGSRSCGGCARKRKQIGSFPRSRPAGIAPPGRAALARGGHGRAAFFPKVSSLHMTRSQCGCYSFTAQDFHLLLLADLPALTYGPFSEATPKQERTVAQSTAIARHGRLGFDQWGSEADCEFDHLYVQLPHRQLSSIEREDDSSGRRRKPAS